MASDNNFYGCCALLAVCALATILFALPDRSVEQEGMEYCRMVWTYKHDPRYGWPDFHHIYAAQCNEDGTLKEEYVRGR